MQIFRQLFLHKLLIINMVQYPLVGTDPKTKQNVKS